MVLVLQPYVDGYDLYGDSLTPYEIHAVFWFACWIGLGYLIMLQIEKHRAIFNNKLDNLNYELGGALSVVAFIGSFVLSYYVLKFLGWVLLFDPF